MTTTITKRDEQFYIERFKKTLSVQNSRKKNEVHCEIYKGFAVLIWQIDHDTPQGTTKSSFYGYVWRNGGEYDALETLGWGYQGVVAHISGKSLTDLQTAFKKLKKKVDFHANIDNHKNELIKLSHSDCPSIWGNDESVFNALVGDVVRINAFGRTRLGKVVSTSGRRFVVAYMTPSNSIDIHHKILPLQFIFPKEKTNP